VDRALESNEPAVFQHQLRELEKLQEQLNDQLVSVRAELSSLRQRNDKQQALVVKHDAEVDQLLQAGLQEDALAAQDRLNRAARRRQADGTIGQAGGALRRNVEAQAALTHACPHSSERPEFDGWWAGARQRPHG